MEIDSEYWDEKLSNVIDDDFCSEQICLDSFGDDNSNIFDDTETNFSMTLKLKDLRIDPGDSFENSEYWSDYNDNVFVEENNTIEISSFNGTNEQNSSDVVCELFSDDLSDIVCTNEEMEIVKEFENENSNLSMFMVESSGADIEQVKRDLSGICARNSENEENLNNNTGSLLLKSPKKFSSRCESPDIFESNSENDEISGTLEEFDSRFNILIKNESKTRAKCISPDLFESNSETEAECDLNNLKKFDEDAISQSNNAFGFPSYLQNFWNPENNLLNYGTNYSSETNERRCLLMRKIENLNQKLIQDLNETGSMELEVLDTSKWSNVSKIDDVIKLSADATSRKIRRDFKHNNKRFDIIMYLLLEIYKLLKSNLSCNLRELYYKNPDLCESDININNALKDICCHLNATPWELGILSTAKGMIAGKICLRTRENEIIDCNAHTKTGYLIPSNIATELEIDNCEAKYVLIVEKDTVFQKLLQHKFLEKFNNEIILITAKGYPDLNSRVLVKKIHDKLKLPIFILVDADPFGIEIMLTYKFGSKARAFNSDQIACSNIQWIGVRPSEIDAFCLSTMPFNREDIKKLNVMLKRSYLSQEIRNELELFKRMKRKAEIEAFFEYTTNFLINILIPLKIREFDKKT